MSHGHSNGGNDERVQTVFWPRARHSIHLCPNRTSSDFDIAFAGQNDEFGLPLSGFIPQCAIVVLAGQEADNSSHGERCAFLCVTYLNVIYTALRTYINVPLLQPSPTLPVIYPLQSFQSSLVQPRLASVSTHSRLIRLTHPDQHLEITKISYHLSWPTDSSKVASHHGETPFWVKTYFILAVRPNLGQSLIPLKIHFANTGLSYIHRCLPRDKTRRPGSSHLVSSLDVRGYLFLGIRFFRPSLSSFMEQSSFRM